MSLTFEKHSELWTNIMIICMNAQKDPCPQTHYPYHLLPSLAKLSVAVGFIIELERIKVLKITVVAAATNIVNASLKLDQRITAIELKRSNLGAEELVETTIQQMYAAIGVKLEQTKRIFMGG